VKVSSLTGIPLVPGAERIFRCQTYIDPAVLFDSVVLSRHSMKSVKSVKSRSRAASTFKCGLDKVYCGGVQALSNERPSCDRASRSGYAFKNA
jgi:hypothetical protein